MIYARFDGPIIVLGLGSIGMGLIPLLNRHIQYDNKKLIAIAPHEPDPALLEKYNIRLIKLAITEENFRSVLTPFLRAGAERPLIINAAVNVASQDIIRLAQENDALYIDTAIELWPNFYNAPNLSLSQKTDYGLREALLELRRSYPEGVTAVTCCGANPGMVSWLVKQALLNIVADLGHITEIPTQREGWARLMARAGIMGIQIAERDTQRSGRPQPAHIFRNTWCVDAFITESTRPSELGWGTGERTLPVGARCHDFGCCASIYLMRSGAMTRVKSWTPSARAQQAFLLPHAESISIADFFSLRRADKVIYRPTCFFAYQPCDDAVRVLEEVCGLHRPLKYDGQVLAENDIVDGMDELGVLLYGHSRNAYWYGSQLSIDATRKLAPYQNATGLQVTSALLAGIVWMLENPRRGIVEPDDMDFERCLELQLPYLGRMIGCYTDWTPLFGQMDPCDGDAWQFKNMIERPARRSSALLQFFLR